MCSRKTHRRWSVFRSSARWWAGNGYGRVRVSGSRGDLGPLLLLLRSDGVPLHGHLNRRLQLAAVKRLQDVAVVLRPARPVHGQLVGIRGQIDNRHVNLLPDLLRRLYAVFLTL